MLVRVNSKTPLCALKQGKGRESQPLDERVVVLHLHAGGFISMDTKNCQNLTRKWAQETDYLIVSIEYRLAPQHPYPAALDDAVQTYFWVLQHLPEQLGTFVSQYSRHSD